MSRRHDHASPEVYSITGARRSQLEDSHGRMLKYGLSMGVRTVCFVLAVVLSGPARYVMFVGAILLPYVAVLIANAGRERIRTPTRVLRGPVEPVFEAAPTPADGSRRL